MQELGATAFTLWGASTSWLEVLAFLLALAMVAFNVREVHWGWLCATASSALYFALFYQNRLYGDAALQVFFAAMSVWGWVQWLRGVRSDGQALRIVRITAPILRRDACIAVALVGCIGFFLQHYTDTDVPWWDAVPTACSIVATVWVARKYIESWPAWIAINAVSVSLYLYKELWLTVVLYLLLMAMAAWGWQAWRRRVLAKEPGSSET
jgi:nicotinamide mononucleotide transporter